MIFSEMLRLVLRISSPPFHLQSWGETSGSWLEVTALLCWTSCTYCENWTLWKVATSADTQKWRLYFLHTYIHGQCSCRYCSIFLQDELAKATKKITKCINVWNIWSIRSLSISVLLLMILSLNMTVVFCLLAFLNCLCHTIRLLLLESPQNESFPALM